MGTTDTADSGEKRIMEELTAIIMVLEDKEAPFLASLVKAADYKLTKEVPIAASDAYKTIYINGDVFIKLPHQERKFVILHEILHLAFKHHWRAEMLGVEDQQLYNIAADCLINGALAKERVVHIDRLSPQLQGIVKPSEIAAILGLSVDTVMSMSTDELYKHLLDKREQIKRKFADRRCGFHKYGHKHGRGKGRKEEEGREAEEVEIERKRAERYWDKKVAEAAVHARVAGKTSANLERLFKIGESKVPWNELLYNAVRTGFYGRVIGTFARRNRKTPLIPGLQWLDVPNVFFCVDTSGSMGESELSLAASEIYTVAKEFRANVTVVFWDAEVQDVQTFTSPSQIVHELKPKGGGGTFVKPTLEYLLEYIKSDDVVVMISDGMIADKDDEDVVDMADRVAARSLSAIFLTTISEPKWPGWQVIKITID